MKTFIVLGYGRTGSSLVAGTLRELGVNMGTKFRPADEANLKGFFENLDFYNLNRAVLREKEYDALDWPPKELGDFLDCKQRWKTSARRYVEQYQEELWGWKDSRTIFTWHLYEPHVENPHFIVCYRNPEAVIASNVARSKNESPLGHRPRDIWLKSIHEHYEQIEEFLQDKTRLNVQYERFFTDFDNQIQELADFVGVGVTESARGFFDKRLRRF